MGWPQIVLIGFIVIALYNSAKNHGKAVERNFGGYAVGTLLNIFLLVAGGFFSVIAWPQIAMIVVYMIGFYIKIDEGSGYDIENFNTTFFSVVIFTILLYFGGFWK